MLSRLCSTTSMVSRISSTVWCSGMVPASADGATPKRFASGAWPKLGDALSCLNQSTKSWMPAWTISPTQERSSALSSANHGRSDSIRFVAAVLSRPDAPRSCLTARARGFGDMP
jgi:hypothetical protein